jgi:hypothetical protein
VALSYALYRIVLGSLEIRDLERERELDNKSG